MKLNVRRLPDRYNDNNTIGISLEIDSEMLRRLKAESDSQTFDSEASYVGLLLYDIIYAATHPQR